MARHSRRRTLIKRLRALDDLSNEMVLAISSLISLALFIVYVTVLHRVI